MCRCEFVNLTPVAGKEDPETYPKLYDDTPCRSEVGYLTTIPRGDKSDLVPRLLNNMKI